MSPPALIVLEDGRAFRGEGFGAAGESFGEAVFTTAMSGYQETLTDPSFAGQVVVMTAPQVGNTGVNDADAESGRIHVAGYVVRDLSPVASSHRSQRSLSEELAAWGVVGVTGVDTRALTRHLRNRGVMRVGLSTVEDDPSRLLDRVLAAPAMAGSELARSVSTREPYVVPAAGPARYRVAALDLGLKRSTVGRLAALGVEVHVVPAGAGAAGLLAGGPDGVFLSNGPGDPAAAGYAVDAVRGVLAAGCPLLAICFGHQLLARALGLDTYKLPFGHRGVNQPVKELATGRVLITSHNHGFAVAAPRPDWRSPRYGGVSVSHVALNDGVVEGLECERVPAVSVQFHPEAAPGPHDAGGFFQRFLDLMGRPEPAGAVDRGNA